jgi:hypothetical protein
MEEEVRFLCILWLFFETNRSGGYLFLERVTIWWREMKKEADYLFQYIIRDSQELVGVANGETSGS